MFLFSECVNTCVQRLCGCKHSPWMSSNIITAVLFLNTNFSDPAVDSSELVPQAAKLSISQRSLLKEMAPVRTADTDKTRDWK